MGAVEWRSNAEPVEWNFSCWAGDMSCRIFESRTKISTRLRNTAPIPSRSLRHTFLSSQ